MPTQKTLFTPGPLTTSRTVKEAMLRDVGSRDAEFTRCVASIRERLLALGQVSKDTGHEAVLMQGSGTYGLEAVISSIVPKDGHLVVSANGAYGERMIRIASAHGISTTALRSPADEPVDLGKLEALLQEDSTVTHVAIVHCETTTGVLNPVPECGRIVGAAGRGYIVDSMSAFGGIPLDVQGAGIDFLISSANKCIEGVPGFSFVICKRASLVESRGRARTVSLDLLAQWEGLESDGQFRFTPPTHVLLAFSQALTELESEGGIAGRHRRYQDNQRHLVQGMRQLGFHEYVAPEHQACIITSFRDPSDARFEFTEFYRRLNERGLVIYPGKVADVPCFRIGTIGRIDTADVERLLDGIRRVLLDMGVRMD